MTSNTTFDLTGEFKLRATHPLTPFLALRKLRAGKASRQLRTARYFWSVPKDRPTPLLHNHLQSIFLAVRLDVLGCNLNCTLGLSSCSHTEGKPPVACLGRQRSTRHPKVPWFRNRCSLRGTQTRQIAAHFLTTTATSVYHSCHLGLI